jgi:hypothetical protein
LQTAGRPKETGGWGRPSRHASPASLLSTVALLGSLVLLASRGSPISTAGLTDSIAGMLGSSQASEGGAGTRRLVRLLLEAGAADEQPDVPLAQLNWLQKPSEGWAMWEAEASSREEEDGVAAATVFPGMGQPSSGAPPCARVSRQHPPAPARHCRASAVLQTL